MQAPRAVAWVSVLLVACAAGPKPPSARATAPGSPSATAASAPAAHDDAALDLLGDPRKSIETVVVTASGHVVASSLEALYDFDPAVPETLRRHALPPDTQSVVLSATRAAVVRRTDLTEIVDLTTFKVQASVEAVGTYLSANGEQLVGRRCGQGKRTGVDCEIGIFDTTSGQRTASIGEGKIYGMMDGAFSDDGRYFAATSSEVGGDQRVVYDARSGKRLLRRVGGQINGSAANELMEIMGDTVLMTRFGLIEVNDLKTGRVLASQRYATPSEDSSIVSLHLPSSTQVATLWGAGKKVFVWDWAAKRVIRTFDLGPKLTEGCYQCAVVVPAPDKLEVLGAPVDLALDMATGAVTSRGEPQPRTMNLYQSPDVRVDYAYRKQGGDVCFVVAGGVRTEVPNMLCANYPRKVQRRGLLIAGSNHGNVGVYDLSKRNMVLSLGPAAPNGMHTFRVVFRDGLLGLISRDDEKPLWLGHDLVQAPKTFPPDHGHGTESSGLRVSLQEKTVQGQNLDGTDAFVQSADFSRGVELWVSGSRAVVGTRIEDGLFDTQLCAAAKGRQPLLSHVLPEALQGAWFVYHPATGTAHQLLNLDTGKTFAIPDATCGQALATVPTATGALIACASLERTPRGAASNTLAVVDQTGARVREITVPLMQFERYYVVVGTSVLLSTVGSDVATARYVLVDLEGRKPDVRIAAAMTGAIALSNHGVYERFGNSEPLLPLLRCVRGDLIRPLSTCAAGREVKGLLVR